MRHSKPVRLETAPTGGRKCLFIFRIHHRGIASLKSVSVDGGGHIILIDTKEQIIKIALIGEWAGISPRRIGIKKPATPLLNFGNNRDQEISSHRWLCLQLC